MFTELPLYLFTLVGGVAAGACTTGAALPPSTPRTRLKLDVVSIVLLGIGGIALFFHLGHPERLFDAFSNASAGITLEGYASLLFGCLVVADGLICALRKTVSRVFGICAGIAGLLLLCAMGYAYSQFIGIPYWEGPLSFFFFILGGLAAGSALLPVVDKELAAKRTPWVANAVLQIAATCVYALVCAKFAALGTLSGALVCGVLLSAVGAVLALFEAKDAKRFPAVLICLVAVCALALVRFGFYAL